MKRPGLLAYLSSRFAWSEEVWATEALMFLLRGCPEINEALRQYVLRSLGVELPPSLSYHSQVVDTESGRPDVVGTDPVGSHQLIIEAKFWAGLTEKQPGGYVQMLTAGKPGVVLVVAPAGRRPTLWPELLANLTAYTGETVSGHAPSAADEASLYELVLSSGHILALRSWRDMLDQLDTSVRVTGLSEWQADLAQLRGLAERMDETGFQPLQSTDLDARTARQISSLLPLVKRLVGEYVNDVLLEKLGPKHKQDPLYFGWWLRSKTCGLSIWAGLYFKAWVEYGCSPLWVGVYPDIASGWTIPVLDRAFSSLQLPAGAGRWEDEDEPGGGFLIPLMMKRSAGEDDVIADLKAQLSAIAYALEIARPSPLCLCGIPGEFRQPDTAFIRIHHHWFTRWVVHAQGFTHASGQRVRLSQFVQQQVQAEGVPDHGPVAPVGLDDAVLDSLRHLGH